MIFTIRGLFKLSEREKLRLLGSYKFQWIDQQTPAVGISKYEGRTGKLINRQIVVNFDEQIIFGQLEQDESAVWSLLVASGYLKVEEIEYRGLTLEP